MEVPLFTYGTLMRRRRLEVLCGCRLPDPVPAVLHGYAKFDTGLGYPVILPQPGGRVEGLLYRVPAEALPYLDHYEGADEDPPHYTRTTVTVEVGGSQVEAQVYVGNPEVYRHLRPLGPGEPPQRPTPTA